MKRLFFVLTILLVGCQLQAQLKAVHLLTDNRVNPVGLGNPSPRFSWLVSSAENNTLQTAYEIRVLAETATGGKQNAIWNSGKIITGQSVFVAYKGPLIPSNTKCSWQVRIWDNHKKQSGWSNTALFQTGLLQISDWKAKWIEASKHEEGAIRPAHVFTKQFVSTKKVQSATVYITAHGVYEAMVNGKRVGDAVLTPGWTAYQKRLQYQAYDVTSFLQKGSNSVEVTVGSGWYRTSLSWSPEQSAIKPKLGLLCQLQVQYSDGSSAIVVSDKSWKVSANGPVRNSEIYDGEILDARLASLPATEPGNAIEVDYSKDNLVATENELVKKHEVLPALRVIKTPKGETVLDFGQNMVGWVNMRMTGKPGDSVRIYHAETLDRDGNFYTENLRGAKQQNLFILNGEQRLYEPHFTFQGFRYIKIEGNSEAINPKNFSAVALYSDMPLAGTFSCSDTLVNRLQKNIEWGQKGNFIDIPSDCPQRDERLGWTGDAQVFTRTAAFNRGVYNFFNKWLKDLSAEQLPDGMVPAVVPNVFGAFQGGSSGWGDAATIIPWELYQVYGDTAVLRQQYASMKAWLTLLKKAAAIISGNRVSSLVTGCISDR